MITTRPTKNSELSEQLYTNCQAYFASIIDAINSAKHTIDVETYIFSNDQLGRKVYAALLRATRRSVSVRVLVDGLGSLELLGRKTFKNRNNFQVRAFHPIPFSRFYERKSLCWSHAYKGFLKLNRRTHKKIIIIDQSISYIGSHNIWDNSLLWHELGIRIQPCYLQISNSFEYSWSRAKSSPRLKSSRKKTKFPSSHTNDRVVVFNFKRKQRIQQIKHLQKCIFDAQEKVWILTPYFSPPLRLLHALCHAARQGKDARIVVPDKIDHLFMKIVARYYFPLMLHCGVTIYEFKPKVLHSKCILIDDWALIGSANFNHRSILYDLEIMISPRSQEVIEQLNEEFLRIVQNSECLRKSSDYKPSWWEPYLGRVLLLLKNWM